MPIKKLIKLTPKKIFNWLTAVIIILTILLMSCTTLFLYKNFYKTITQTKEIIILREKVALDTIDMNKFNLIIKKIDQKVSPEEFKNITNPFR